MLLLWIFLFFPILTFEWLVLCLIIIGVMILFELGYFQGIYNRLLKKEESNLNFEFEIHWPQFLEQGRPKRITIVWKKKIEETSLQILMPKEFSPRVVILNTASEHFRITGKKKKAYTDVEIYLTRFSRLRLFQICYKLYHDRKINVVSPILYLSKNNLPLREKSSFHYLGGESEFHSIRPYQMEDSFRHINWRKSASSSKELYVNIFEKEHNRKILIILNNGMLSNFEYKGVSYFDHQTALAFQLAFTFLKNQDHTGLLTFSDTIDLFIPPKLDRTQISVLFSHLQKMEPGYGHIDLGHIYSFLKTKLSSQSILIFLSPFLSFQQIFLQKKIIHLLGKLYQMIWVNPLRYSNQPGDLLDLSYLWSRAHTLNEQQDQFLFFKKNNLLYVQDRPDRLYRAVIQNYSRLKW